VGISRDGRRLVVVAVDDWIVDWFGAPRRRHVGSRERCFCMSSVARVGTIWRWDAIWFTDLDTGRIAYRELLRPQGSRCQRIGMPSAPGNWPTTLSNRPKMGAVCHRLDIPAGAKGGYVR
jgi:hypothetical protein